ncbi:hypothetical protein BLNAU_18670 [Blattamonas nauphoetae]|uniref:Uncharacterized protein n=1 Tax=Blattamonas nauphoetae TaxID=2049346 RepID=A0ABQ9X524_9EUKA|nr:hypothetical protein BLNAU_18670 [Blattamonas nauphoetae]
MRIGEDRSSRDEKGRLEGTLEGRTLNGPDGDWGRPAVEPSIGLISLLGMSVGQFGWMKTEDSHEQKSKDFSSLHMARLCFHIFLPRHPQQSLPTLHHFLPSSPHPLQPPHSIHTVAVDEHNSPNLTRSPLPQPIVNRRDCEGGRQSSVVQLLAEFRDC